MKSKLRTITVGGMRYRWMLRAALDGVAWLRVWPEARRDSPLEVRFTVPALCPCCRENGPPETTHVTPAIVRREIEAALAAGWPRATE